MNRSNRSLSGHRLIATSAVSVLALAACSHSTEHASAAAPPSDVQVFFDRGSSTLTDAANKKLDQAARFYREGDSIVMFVVTGYADSTGGEYTNLLLSGQRALATKEALVARGIPAARLEVQAMGSSLPSDPKAAVPENNRRAVITWR
jgi:OOP family OmpA-OmpF porin